LKASGASVERVPATNGVAGDIIVARLAGRGKGKLMLLAHMDTVYQRGALARAPFRIADEADGKRAYGPGIADDKGGVAVILHALRLVRPRDYRSLTIVINTDEERGSTGSSAQITELARGQDAVLSFEPTIMPEMLLRATSGIAGVNITITGKASHAGAAPELGINALTEAAAIIARTTDLDQGPGKLRFNWTMFEQPRAVRNIIPEKVILGGDLRYTSAADFEAFKAEFARRTATPSVAGAQVTVSIEAGRPAFSGTPAGDALIARAKAIYASLGHTLTVVPLSGGGTDAGYAALAGVPVIEAMGLPGFGYHSGAAEYVHLDAVPRRLYLAAEMIRQLGR
jgi:glutamate carboxypeptidase